MDGLVAGLCNALVGGLTIMSMYGWLIVSIGTLCVLIDWIIEEFIDRLKEQIIVLYISLIDRVLNYSPLILH